MLVREFMTKKVHVVEEDTPIYRAERRMRRHGIRRLPVVKGESLVGILSWSDILAALPSTADLTTTAQQRLHIVENPVSLIMSKKVQTVSPTELLTQAALLMAEKKVGGVPVVEDGKIVGMLTETDVFRAFVRILGISGKSERRVYDLPRGNRSIREALDELDREGLTVQSLVTYRDREEGKRRLTVWAVARGPATSSRRSKRVDRWLPGEAPWREVSEGASPRPSPREH